MGIDVEFFRFVLLRILGGNVSARLALDMSSPSSFYKNHSSNVAAVAHAGAVLRATMMRVQSACLCEAQRI